MAELGIVSATGRARVTFVNRSNRPVNAGPSTRGKIRLRAWVAMGI
jgi:hypothetical protein